jgi:hypothetical protein
MGAFVWTCETAAEAVAAVWLQTVFVRSRMSFSVA